MSNGSTITKYKLATFALLAITYSYNSQAISLNESLALAIENNPTFKTLQENFKQSTEIYSSTIADNFMPRFSASLSWQTNIGGSNSRSNQSGSNVTAALPLFNGGAGLASLKRANLVVINNKYDFYTKEQAKILDCINNYLQYHFEKETYDLQVKAVEAFTKTFQSAQEKFKLGEETNTEVSLAKSELAKAEVRRLDSLAAYNNSKEKFINDFNVEPDSTNLPILEKLPFSSIDDFLKTVLNKNFDILTATNSIKLTNLSAVRITPAAAVLLCWEEIVCC
jgi:outer membrane protein